jgi:hypothetical protein
MTEDDGGGESLLAVEEDVDYMKTLLRTFDDDADDDFNINFDEIDRKKDMQKETLYKSDFFSEDLDADSLAVGLDCLACLFETNQETLVRPGELVWDSFWDENNRYARVLRLFSEIMRSPDTKDLLLERIDEDELAGEGKLPYSSIVKHPLCLREVLSALFEDFDANENSVVGKNGILPVATLSSWNMWHGSELVQAIDLVFLNSLAYGKANGESKSNLRSRINRLRKTFWDGVKEVINEHIPDSDSEGRRRVTPTRRGESSGFVVHKCS